MARYKRYFPVSHDINADPEVWAITKEAGDRSFRFILEIFCMIDRHDNQLVMTQDTLEVLAKKTRISIKTATYVLFQMLANHWLTTGQPLAREFPMTISARNYAEYHRTRSVNVANFPGKGRVLNSSLKEEMPEREKITDRLPSGEKPKRKGRKKIDGVLPENALFEKFWVLYPWKSGKREALESWIALNPQNGLAEKICAAVLEQKTWPSWTKEGGKYIPRATTWLNNHRWEDVKPAVEKAMPKFQV